MAEVWYGTEIVELGERGNPTPCRPVKANNLSLTYVSNDSLASPKSFDLFTSILELYMLLLIVFESFRAPVPNVTRHMIKST